MAEFDEIGPFAETETHTGQATEPSKGESPTVASDGVVAVPAMDEPAPAAEEPAAVVGEATLTDGTPETADTGDALPPESEPATVQEPEAASDPLDEVKEQLLQILSETEKYNTRAAQREGVIDSMHAELEGLRHGERRSLLRPLVSEVCRLRDDILRQADALPDPFDASKTADLLRSYADSLEFALEDNGISSYAPKVGDAYEVRLHRASGKTPTTDASLAGTIATVVSPGYRDIEAETVIAAARVTVFTLDEAAAVTAIQTSGAAAPKAPPQAQDSAPTATSVASADDAAAFTKGEGEAP